MSHMDEETPELFDAKWVVGRKQYKCCECYGVIEKKERHMRYKGLWDHRWDCFRQCAGCAEVFSDMLEIYDNTELFLTELDDAVENTDGERKQSWWDFLARRHENIRKNIEARKAQ